MRILTRNVQCRKSLNRKLNIAERTKKTQTIIDHVIRIFIDGKAVSHTHAVAHTSELENKESYPSTVGN